ncbi:MAG: putative 4-hydroxybenzoate polyprenyltransferase [Candidatus Cloacimonetes bacterium]|nr:putative 4-hydroxybenzoate polyprenyltransferase [Candidatus Cloacimonadota bacterium]
MKDKFSQIIQLVKLQHALFALPFTMSSMFLAANGFPGAKTSLLIIIAFMSARSFGMAMNRWIDKDIDAKNPRTEHRLMASGKLGTKELLPYLLMFCLIFGLSCYYLNPLAFKLVPISLFIMVLYPLCKKFTVFAHTVLGLVLAIAPVGAWVAVRNELDIVPALIGLGILFWVNGFDIIYAIQDEDFDKEHSLHSIPSKFGKANSLKIASLLHMVVPFCFYAAGHLYGLGVYFQITIAIISALLVYEHRLVHKGYQKNISLAFFKLNSTISLLFMVGVICEVFL